MGKNSNFSNTACKSRQQGFPVTGSVFQEKEYGIAARKEPLLDHFKLQYCITSGQFKLVSFGSEHLVQDTFCYFRT
jgi:hypothetical protein